MFDKIYAYKPQGRFRSNILPWNYWWMRLRPTIISPRAFTTLGLTSYSLITTHSALLCLHLYGKNVEEKHKIFERLPINAGYIFQNQKMINFEQGFTFFILFTFEEFNYFEKLQIMLQPNWLEAKHKNLKKLVLLFMKIYHFNKYFLKKLIKLYQIVLFIVFEQMCFINSELKLSSTRTS